MEFIYSGEINISNVIFYALILFLNVEDAVKKRISNFLIRNIK